MCKCIAMADKALLEHNTQIDTVLTFTPGGKLRARLCIPTARIDTKKRGAPMRMFASHCPMCGEEIPK